MPQPTVSVDRAVAHYLESFDLDQTGLATYYDSLPYAGKPGLDDCRIHFSALAPYDGMVHRESVWLREPQRATRLDPKAPPADITLFVGSFVANNSLETMDDSLRAQLRNHAHGQGHDPWLNEEGPTLERRMHKLQHWPYLRRFAGKAAIWGAGAEFMTEAFGNGNTVGALIGGAAIGVAQYIVDRINVPKQRKKTEKLLTLHRKNVDHGLDFSTIGEYEIPLTTAPPQPDRPWHVPRPELLGSPKSWVRQLHKRLSLTPPKTA